MCFTPGGIVRRRHEGRNLRSHLFSLVFRGPPCWTCWGHFWEDKVPYQSRNPLKGSSLKTFLDPDLPWFPPQKNPGHNSLQKNDFILPRRIHPQHLSFGVYACFFVFCSEAPKPSLFHHLHPQSLCHLVWPRKSHDIKRDRQGNEGMNAGGSSGWGGPKGDLI